MNCDNWLDLFQVAEMAKFSISTTELIRDVTDQTPKVCVRLGKMEEDTANKKVVSVMFLSLGEAARKLFKDKYHHTTLWNWKAKKLIHLATDSYQVKRNCTLDCHSFFARIQPTGESLLQFWHALNDLAAPCDFEEVKSTLVLDTFILHMGNKKAQENFCTAPKDSEQALEVAIAFEEKAKRQVKRHASYIIFPQNNSEKRASIRSKKY